MPAGANYNYLGRNTPRPAPPPPETESAAATKRLVEIVKFVVRRLVRVVWVLRPPAPAPSDARDAPSARRQHERAERHKHERDARLVERAHGAEGERLGPLELCVFGAESCVAHQRQSLGRVRRHAAPGDEAWGVVSWPLQDIRSLRGYCARINHPFIPHTHLHWPHCCNTIARLLGSIAHLLDPPFVWHTPYTIGNNNIL